MKINWYTTYRPARFIFMDVRVGIIILISLLHVRYWTLSLDVLIIIAGYLAERRDLDFMGILRTLRSYIAGTVRPALPAHKIRGTVDYGRRKMAWEKRPDQTPIALTPVKEEH